MVTIETKFGEVTVSTAMFDIDGKNLEEGVEIKLDDELVIELYGFREYNFEDMSVSEVEELLIKNKVV